PRKVAPQSPKADPWYEKLLKYMPAEAIGLYVALLGVIHSSGAQLPELRWYLAGALVISLVFEWLFLTLKWKVSRVGQKVISSLAFLAYVFGTGGVFETFAFYRPWHGTAVILVAAAFLGLVDPPGPRVASARASSR